MMIIFLSDNKQAVTAVLESNSELIKDALSELDQVSNAFLFFIWEWLFSPVNSTSPPPHPLPPLPAPTSMIKENIGMEGQGRSYHLFDLILPAFLDTGLPRGNGHKWDSGPMRGAIPTQSTQSNTQSHNP